VVREHQAAAHSAPGEHGRDLQPAFIVAVEKGGGDRGAKERPDVDIGRPVLVIGDALEADGGGAAVESDLGGPEVDMMGEDSGELENVDDMTGGERGAVGELAGAVAIPGALAPDNSHG